MPLVSVSNTWSIVSPISSPATALPAARWLSISLCVRLLPIGSALVPRDELAALGADVVRARADQPVVVVLLDDVGAPAGDAAGRDHRREEIDGDAEGVEERRGVEVHGGGGPRAEEH